MAAGLVNFSRAVRLLVGVAAIAALIGVHEAGVTPSASNPAARTVANPVTIFSGTDHPAGSEDSDRSSVELGVQFRVSTPGDVTSIRFYKTAANSGTHTGSLWSASGQRLATGTFTHESPTGWQTLVLTRSVPVVPSTRYIASYHAPHGQYAEAIGQFATGSRTIGNRYISALAGLYTYGSVSRVPASAWNHAGYGVDVQFRPTTGGTTIPPRPRPSPSPTPPRHTTPPAPKPPAPKPPTPPGKPVLSGYPNASNSGLPAHTSLRAVPQAVRSGPGWHWDSRGWVVIDKAGTTFSGYKVTGGAVEVYAAGVTVKNNDIENDGNSWAIGLRPGSSATTVEHNNLHGPCLQCADRLTYGVAGFLGGDTSRSRILANNLYFIDHPLQQESGLIRDNYVHQLAALPSGTDHVDAFFSGGGDTHQLTLVHNSLINDYTGDGSTASIMLNNAFGVQSNRLIEDNLVAGGGFLIYGGGAETSGSNVVIRNNKFSTAYYPRGGYYGSVVYLLPAVRGNTYTGNVWADGPAAGRAVSR